MCIRLSFGTGIHECVNSARPRSYAVCCGANRKAPRQRQDRKPGGLSDRRQPEGGIDSGKAAGLTHLDSLKEDLWEFCTCRSIMGEGVGVGGGTEAIYRHNA